MFMYCNTLLYNAPVIIKRLQKKLHAYIIAQKLYMNVQTKIKTMLNLNHFYLVGTTQYRRTTGGEVCRVIASANNALRFFASFRSLLIRLHASCKQQCLVFTACRHADKDLNQRNK